MEPSDLNSPPSPADDDVLENLLRRHSPPALADDGFSARVLTALPSAPATRQQPPRLVIIVVAGLAGTALAVTGISAGGGPASISSTLADQFKTFSPAFGGAGAAPGPALIVATLSTIISLVYAFRPRVVRRRAFAL